MRGALKFIMTAVGLALIGLFIAAVLLLTQFEGLLRKGLTHQAGRVLECEIRLEGVRFDWLEQALVFKGVSLYNPAEFTDREAVRVGSLVVKLDPLTLFSKTPRIREIHLRETSAHLQYKIGAGTNLGVLMAHAGTWADRQDAGELPLWGRPIKIHAIRADAVDLKVEGLAPPTPTAPLPVAAYTVDAPGGGEAIPVARAVELLFRSLLHEARQLDTMAAPLKELLNPAAEPVAAT